MQQEDDENLVEITIGTSLTNLDTAKKDANDLAWEHATELARSTGLSLGSEDFEELFRQLSQRYDKNTDYLKFFLMTAMMTIRDLLESDTLALPHVGEQISETEVLELVSAAARALVGSYMWLTAGQDITWPTNEQMPEELTVSFYFDADDVTEPDEEV